MKKDYRDYLFEDFLDDPDFIQWAQSTQTDSYSIFNEIPVKSPEKKAVIEKAKLLIQSLDDKRISTDKRKKLESWNSLYNTYKHAKPVKVYIRLLPYAAAVMLAALITSLGYHYFSRDNKDQFITTYNRQDFTETKLILNNGQEINIPEDESEIIYHPGNGHVTVNDRAIKLDENKKHTQVNHLIVPFGKSSKIILPDSSVVWINAGSVFSYPETFDKNLRKVSILGEAYFEVAHLSDCPFLVNVADITIKVLGTRFNLSAYSEDNEIITVLIDGSIALTDNTLRGFFEKEVILKPMQKASFIKDTKTMNITQIEDAEFYIAWKEGWFKFEQESLTGVLNKLEKYFNIEIELNSRDYKFDLISGSLDLTDSLNNVFLALSDVADIEFYITENKVLINKKK